MSEFADYVERQQQSRRTNPGLGQPLHPTESTLSEDHDELDILDTLNLAESSAHVRLKELLLDTSDGRDDTLEQLSDLIQNRLLEGHGETLFDLGQEDNGESMAFSKEQWDVALDRIRQAASFLRAECRILLTRNVGGPEEAETVNEKDKSVSGKLLIRQNPATIEDVIETRIAVVGNGRKLFHHRHLR